MKFVSCQRLAAAAVATLAVVLVGPAPQADAASPSWTVQATPNPGGTHGSQLGSVSCSSATACTAVGAYANASGVTEPLALRWNGTKWTVEATPNPSGTRDLHLSGVSCISATACTAVGDYVTASQGQLTLAERWNGAKWTVEATPNPSGTHYVLLNSVSCTSATACTATGYFFNVESQPVTVVERWNGTQWTVQSTPYPVSYGLEDVSCTSATVCTAVGHKFDASNVQVTLAERWNGAKWTVEATPNPSGTRDLHLSGVSCISATACTAVGDFYNVESELVTVAERWNGTQWTIQTTQNPGPANELYSVSCTSATACTAVGYGSASTREGNLAEQWNGTAWTVQTTPNPYGSWLNGVSCISAIACMAVGTYYNASQEYFTLAERYS